jgi:hypothetical protein
MPLNDVIGFECANNPLVHFDLNCRVADAKTPVQLKRDLYEKFIPGMAACIRQ